MRTAILYLILGILAFPLFAQKKHPAQKAYAIQGIDVSKWQGEINWKAVKKDQITFAFAKATQGIKWRDPMYKKNRKGMKKNKIVKGAYHFFESKHSGKTQAKHYWKTAKWKKGDLPPVLDLERIDKGTKAKDMLREARVWLDWVEDKCDCKPLIYTNRNFFEKHLREQFNDYPYWIARYRKKAPDFTTWLFWQYTDKGRVKGIKGKVDRNAFFGSTEAFNRLIRK